MALLKSNSVELGWQAQDFNLKDANGQSFSLTELQNGKPLLMAFICNHCPYVISIIERLVSDAKTLQAEGINVVAIMSNDYATYPADNPERMREFSQQHGFSFPYLILVDSKRLASHRVFIRNSISRWWNLDKFRKSGSL